MQRTPSTSSPALPSLLCPALAVGSVEGQAQLRLLLTACLRAQGGCEFPREVQAHCDGLHGRYSSLPPLSLALARFLRSVLGGRGARSRVVSAPSCCCCWLQHCAVRSHMCGCVSRSRVCLDLCLCLLSVSVAEVSGCVWLCLCVCSRADARRGEQRSSSRCSAEGLESRLRTRRRSGTRTLPPPLQRTAATELASSRTDATRRRSDGVHRVRFAS
eukprot:2812834-Rhodomonas_salina.1